MHQFLIVTLTIYSEPIGDFIVNKKDKIINKKLKVILVIKSANNRLKMLQITNR